MVLTLDHARCLMRLGGWGVDRLGDEITVAPPLLVPTLDLFRGATLMHPAPRVHVDTRLPGDRWHVGAPVEGPCRPGQRHPSG